MKAKLIIEGKEIEIEISEEEYKKLQPSEEKKTGYERVAEESDYFYANSRGYVETASEDCYDDIDNEYYESANYYSSETVAENNARADKLMCQLRRFSVEHREDEIDWNNTDIKFWIVYKHLSSSLVVGKGASLQSFGNIYFDSEETAQAAIDEFHDELIWYFTEYKDSL